jgi:hypothetical protein
MPLAVVRAAAAVAPSASWPSPSWSMTPQWSRDKCYQSSTLRTCSPRVNSNHKTPVCLSIHLAVHLSVSLSSHHPSISLSTHHPYVYQYVHVSLAVHLPFICLSVFQSVNLIVSQSVHLFNLSVCTAGCLTVSLYTWPLVRLSVHLFVC